MDSNKFIRTGKHPGRADQSAVGTINRPLQGVGVVYFIASSASTGVRGIVFMSIIGLLSVSIAEADASWAQ